MKSALAEDSQAAFVFNCSSGRGRTTTAMVIAVLTLWHFNVGTRVCSSGGQAGAGAAGKLSTVHSSRGTMGGLKGAWEGPGWAVGCGCPFVGLLVYLAPSKLQEKCGCIPGEPLPNSQELPPQDEGLRAGEIWTPLQSRWAQNLSFSAYAEGTWRMPWVLVGCVWGLHFCLAVGQWEQGHAAPNVLALSDCPRASPR